MDAVRNSETSVNFKHTTLLNIREACYLHTFPNPRIPKGISSSSIKQVRWSGHIMQLEDDKLVKQIVKWNPRGKKETAQSKYYLERRR
jgi:hypothetical protein